MTEEKRKNEDRRSDAERRKIKEPVPEVFDRRDKNNRRSGEDRRSK